MTLSQKCMDTQKFDLVYQTVSPRERVGSGDETSHKPPASFIFLPLRENEQGVYKTIDVNKPLQDNTCK